MWKVADGVNRMYLGISQTHIKRKEQGLTSDSPGRPLPESDMFCHLENKKEKNEATKRRGKI